MTYILNKCKKRPVNGLPKRALTTIAVLSTCRYEHALSAAVIHSNGGVSGSALYWVWDCRIMHTLICEYTNVIIILFMT